MYPRTRLLTLTLAAVAACGDNKPGGDSCADIDPPAEDGPLGSPVAFVHDDCDSGSLAGFDPTGLWYVEPSEEAGGFSGGTIEFSLDCADGLAAIDNGNPVGHVSLTDDDLFWRQEFMFQGSDARFIQATVICRLNGDGTLSGHSDTCAVDENGDTQCFGATDVILSRFGRLPGEDEADGLELVSEFAGAAGEPWDDGLSVNVRVSGGIAYVVRLSGGLRIVNVSDPARPRELGHFAREDDNYNDVKIATGPGGEIYALCASNSNGVDVIDVTDPEQPEKVAFFAPNGDADNGVHTLFTETIAGQTRAYLADGGGPFMPIFDVTDPANPVSIGGYTAPDPEWGFHDLFVADGRVYINATFGGLLVVDTLVNPTAPTLIGQFLPEDDPYLYSHSNWVTTAGGRTISVHGDEGYSAHLRVVDVDPASDEFMEVIGELQLRRQTSIHNIMAFGERAYVAHYQDGIRIVDLSDPTEPRVEAYFNTWDPENAHGGIFEGAVGIDVDLDAGLIYVADIPRGLLILRESD